MPPFAAITASIRRGMLSIQTLAFCWSSILWCHSLVIVSTNWRLVVITSFAIARLVSSHMFSIGFMSGEFPGQGKTVMFLWARNSVTLLALWHGAESCIKTYSSSSGNHSSSCGSSRVSSTRLYWSCLIVPSTMYRRPVPLAEITDHTITLTGCFTFSMRQSGWNCSPGRRRTNELLSTKIWNVDSSEKHTCKISQ